MISESRITGGPISTLDVEDIRRVGYASLDTSTFEATTLLDLIGVSLGLESDDPSNLWTPASDFVSERFFRAVSDASGRPDMRLGFLHSYLKHKDYYLANASWMSPVVVCGDLYQYQRRK